MTTPKWTLSDDPATRELQYFLTTLTMNIAEQLNATKARFQKSLGEVSSKITALKEAVDAAHKTQQDALNAIANGVATPQAEPITPEIITLVTELADLAGRFDDLVPDEVPAPPAPAEELPAGTEPPGE